MKATHRQKDLQYQWYNLNDLIQIHAEIDNNGHQEELFTDRTFKELLRLCHHQE